MTDDDDFSPVTADHAKWFGFIVHTFAKIETNMMVCAAGMLGTDLGTSYILMADTHYRQKRQTLLNLNKTLGINDRIDADLEKILDDLHKLSGLRNAIAHSTWTKGNRANSIKPMQLILRGKEPKPLGHHHNEQSYTPADLERECKKLDEIFRRFRLFLRGSGLVAKVATRLEEAPRETSADPGNPSAT